MKNFKLILFVFSVFGLILTSCEPSVEAPGVNDSSDVTFLPLITLEGGDVTLDCNTDSYSDPGAVASAGGQEIPLITDVEGLYYGGSTVDGPDIYNVSYSAFNADDIPATGFREVLWPPCNGDLVTSIAGMYTISSLVRTPGYATSDIGPLFITDEGNGVYAISDAIGCWYEHEYGYGPDYASKGMTVIANDIATNDFTLSDSTSLPWGGTLVLTDFTVDAGAGTVSWTIEWDFGYVWEVTAQQM